MIQASLFAEMECDQVVFLPDWTPRYIPEKRLLVSAEKIPETKCMKCPMAAHWHPMIQLGLNGDLFNKVCTIPLLISKRVKISEIMKHPGGCGALDTDEAEARRMLRSIWRKRKKAA